MNIKEVMTKRGQKMAFVRIEDTTGDVEAIVFPGVYDGSRELWQKDKVVVIGGKVSSKDKDGSASETKLIVDDIKPIDDTREIKLSSKSSAPVPTSNNTEKKVYIRMKNSDDEELLMKLKTAMDGNPGTETVVLVVGDNSSKQAIKLPSKVEVSGEMLDSLKDLFGVNSVKYQ